MAAKRGRRARRGVAAAAIESHHPLPACEGPKLGRFKHSSAAVEFVGLLGAEADGKDGQVFEVVIESKHYALKLVRDPPSPTNCSPSS
jgi:Kinetochore Sim4 complex subunit FTA2